MKLIEIKRRKKRRLEKELREVDRRLAFLEEQLALLNFTKICRETLPTRKGR